MVEILTFPWWAHSTTECYATRLTQGESSRKRVREECWSLFTAEKREYSLPPGCCAPGWYPMFQVSGSLKNRLPAYRPRVETTFHVDQGSTASEALCMQWLFYGRLVLPQSRLLASSVVESRRSGGLDDTHRRSGAVQRTLNELSTRTPRWVGNSLPQLSSWSPLGRRRTSPSFSRTHFAYEWSILLLFLKVIKVSEGARFLVPNRPSPNPRRFSTAFLNRFGLHWSILFPNVHTHAILVAVSFNSFIWAEHPFLSFLSPLYPLPSLPNTFLSFSGNLFPNFFTRLLISFAALYPLFLVFLSTLAFCLLACVSCNHGSFHTSSFACLFDDFVSLSLLLKLIYCKASVSVSWTFTAIHPTILHNNCLVVHFLTLRPVSHLSDQILTHTHAFYIIASCLGFVHSFFDG